jgi:hypothetical protein
LRAGFVSFDTQHSGPGRATAILLTRLQSGLGQDRLMILPRPPAFPLPPVAATLAVAVLAWWLTAGHMTLTGLLPLIGPAALAFTVRHLLLQLDAPQPDRAAALLFLLPSVLLGPYDAIWAAICVMALAAALDRQHITMLVWYGLAVGLDLRAALIAPFFLALLINRRLPFRLWPIAPAIAAETMLAGWRPADLAAYFEASANPPLSFDAPNLWTIAQALPFGLPLLGLALAAAIGSCAAYIANFSARPLSDRALLNAALLASLVSAGLLPGMHANAFFLADILALILALGWRDMMSWTIAILVQAGSLLAWLGAFSGVSALAMLGGIAMLVATVRLARSLLKPAANDNPLMARAI